MNTTEIREELARLDSHCGALEAEAAKFKQLRTTALSAQPFSPLRRGDVDAADRELDRIAREAERAVARVEVLTAQLPSEEDIQTAREQASVFQQRAEEARRAFESGATTVLQKCEDVCEAVRAMCQERAAHDALRRCLTGLRVDYGLSIDIPPAATVADAKIIRLVGVLLMQAAEGMPEPQVSRDLTAALVRQVPR